MENLTREQADELAQKLANETEKPYIIWCRDEPFRTNTCYGVVSGRDASEPQKVCSVGYKWPGEVWWQRRVGCALRPKQSLSAIIKVLFAATLRRSAHIIDNARRRCWWTNWPKRWICVSSTYILETARLLRRPRLP